LRPPPLPAEASVSAGTKRRKRRTSAIRRGVCAYSFNSKGVLPMKRRAFCASALSVFAATSVPWQRALAAAAASVPVSGATGKQVVLQPADIDDLRASLRGDLLVPGQEGYEAARHVWNG